MADQYIKRIVVFALLVIFLCPFSVNAQTDAQNESVPKFSHEELAQMLAPIALYPDALLSQVLIAASYPFEVVEAERWVAKNQYLTGQALDDALQEKDWDISVLSLCYYPKVLTMMTDNLSWTSRLGDAFVNQEQEMMDTVQEMRAKARAQGNLVTTSQQQVILENNTIRIEPAYDDYLYIPAYDPYVVYGTWWYPTYPPFTIYYPGVALGGARIVFSPGIYVGFGFFGWSSFDWMNRTVAVVNIDRQRRYNNRHVYMQKSDPRVRWRPDDQRRLESRQRAPEIPPFRPPVRPPYKYRGIVAPSKSKPIPTVPRVIDRRPDSGQRQRALDKAKPPQSKPPVTDRDKPAPPIPGAVKKMEPRASQPVPVGPRVIDRRPDGGQRTLDKVTPPHSTRPVFDRDKPATIDRGAVRTIEPTKSQPGMERKGALRTNAGESPPNQNIQRSTRSEERQNKPQRNTESDDRKIREDQAER